MLWGALLMVRRMVMRLPLPIARASSSDLLTTFWPKNAERCRAEVAMYNRLICRTTFFKSDIRLIARRGDHFKSVKAEKDMSTSLPPHWLPSYPNILSSTLILFASISNCPAPPGAKDLARPRGRLPASPTLFKRKQNLQFSFTNICSVVAHYRYFRTVFASLTKKD